MYGFAVGSSPEIDQFWGLVVGRLIIVSMVEVPSNMDMTSVPEV